MVPLIMSNDKKIGVREKIVIAAHDLFYSTGLKATGVDKIIKQAKVTKVTFYRYFPGKSLLIIAYLHYRHEIWINWFRLSLSSKLDDNKILPDALSETLDEWFHCSFFRGCAFINATAEAESEDIAEEIKEICRNHKTETREIISSLMENKERNLSGEIMMLIDGAIIHAQMGMDKKAITGELNIGLRRLLSDLEEA